MGKRVIGGGGLASNEHIFTPVALVASRPDVASPDDTWTVLVEEMAATEDTHRAFAWAYCAKVAP